VVTLDGHELFDLVDDFITDVDISDYWVRVPGAGDHAGQFHELVFPAGISEAQVRSVLADLPSEEIARARAADAAT
jgi:hypothetical protein